MQILDLILEAYDDYLLADVVEAVMETKLPQKGFNREFALGIIKGKKREIQLAIAQGLILEFVKQYGRRITFLLEDDEIISVFCLRDNEKGYSADVEIALRGTLEQRIRAIRYWNKNKDSIFKKLYDIGYRRMYLQSRQEMERLVKVIMRGETNEAFSSIKMLRTCKFNNKVMPYKEYLLNLGVKYK